MPIIDAQVHAFERNHPGRPWLGEMHGLASASAEEMIAHMDAQDVDASVLVSSFSLYRYDPSYAREVGAAYPDRFALVTPVDAAAANVGEIVDEWAKAKGAVGVRILFPQVPSTDPDDPGIKRILTAATRNNLAVNLFCWERLDQVHAVAAKNPDANLVIDHLGITQPFNPPVPADAWADLPKVLALAKFKNVSIKISGACTLSHQGYPYDDIWPPILKIIDAFGIDRCMWGTDWTRAVNLLTYQQGVDAFRAKDWLSDGDRATLMGGSLTKIYGWAPKKG